jgi:hypothetical protein
MNESMYSWYKNTQNNIKKAMELSENGEIAEQIMDWQQAICIMEIACPDLKTRYDRDTSIQNSFTREQIDFINWQIGDWYLNWKGHIANKDGTHRLGIAKEQLKSMICGD